MSRFVNIMFIFIVAVFLTACGGGGGGAATTPTDPQTTTINGIAVDNYISSATVCIDTNKNNICDAGEVSTTTNSSGAFSFSNVTLTDEMVIIAYGGTDAITRESFPYIIKNLATNKDANNKVILSSINTLITDYKFENNTTLDDAKTKVVTFLGVDTIKAIQDVIANKSTNATEFLRSLKLFQMIATLNDINNSTSSALSFKKLAQAIGSNTSLQHDQNMTINSKLINSSTSYTPVLLSKKEFFYYPDMSPANQFSIEAYDPNNRSLTYTMINSKDYDDFNISGTNLSFKTAKTSISNPTDSNGDGTYEVDVNISNGVTSTIKTFTVMVKNYNRTALPTLSGTYIFSAEDNMTVNTIIGSISPSSIGTNDAIIKYELNATNYFDINQSNGNLYVNNTLPLLNSAQSNPIPLKLRVLNSAGWSDYADVNITEYYRGEINTTATIVATTFETIYENNSSSQTIGTVQVGITGGHPVTDFNITSGNSNGYFEINSSGVLGSIAHSFDYETVNSYTLGVSASNNNGWGSPSNIIVNIKDVNDKPIYSTSSVFDRNVSVDTNLSVTISGIADGDTADQTISTPTVVSSNPSAVTVNSIAFNQTTGNLSFNLEGKDSGESNITVTLMDNGGILNGGVDTTSFPFKVIVRLNGMKYYERQKASNYTNNSITFDGITYDWNSTKQWYETTNTILMPVVIVSNARNAYLAGNFKEIAEGHYYVNKSEYIWDVNKSQTHTALTQYRNATDSADMNVTAKNNNFQHDAYHNFFVSMVTVNSNGEVQSRKYNEWTHASSNFVDANDSNMSYATAISYSPNYIHTTGTYDVKYVDSNNTNNATSSECLNMYGKGWRIPTAYEIGLRTNTYNDVKNGSNSNYNYVPAYVGSEEISIASSSVFKDDSNNYFIAYLKAIKYSAQDGLWGNGNINTQELHVRCIYQP